MKPRNEEQLNSYYKNLYSQTGNGYPIVPFEGGKYQKGHGLGSIFSSLLPIVKKIAAPVGKTLLQSGLNVAKDALEGKSLKDSLKSNLKKTGTNLITKSIDSLARKTGSTKKANKRKRPRSAAVITKKARKGKRSKHKDIFA